MKNKYFFPCLGAILYTFLGNPNLLQAQTGPPITQQQSLIIGTVTDPLGPIPGVHILLKGHDRGTFSDQNGNYQLTAAPNDTLIFSYLGYKTVELPVGTHTQINIQLKEDVTTLQEVEVNAGYYTVKERERTGNISKVIAEEIELQPVISPIQALQGRMAGVEITQGSGVTGLASTIRIRGRNSLRFEGDYPLYIIDGVPVNSSPISSINPFALSSGMDPLNTLNMNNIESIEVLKDADATAIYGSRGANGVVLITTKKGSAVGGKTTIQTQLYSGLSAASNRMELLNTPEYLAMRREAFANDGITPTERNARDLVLWDQHRQTDWQKVLFGNTAAVTHLNMAVSGGNSKTTFLLGGSYHKEGTVFPGNSGYNKFTANINVNHRSENHKFQLNFSTNYGVENNELFFGTNYINTALTLAPNAPPIYNDDGSLNWENGSWTNPLASLYKPQQIRSDNILSNLSISYEILRGLRIKANLGYSNLTSGETTRNLIDSYDPATWDWVVRTSNHSTNKRNSWIVEPQLVYHNNTGKWTFDALTGLTFQNNKNSFLFMEGSGYGDDRLVGNLAAADEVRVFTDTSVDYKYAAAFGRLAAHWDGKYFLNLTGRRDGSSKFGPGKRFENFWAAGTAWIFSEEAFFTNNLSFLSFGKLRASYGTTGSDQIPDYGYLDAYESTLGPGGVYPTQLFNPDYSWEVNKKLETAIQLGFMEDRINLGISWYRNRSSNQLVGYPLSAITGFTSVQANLPALIQNTGWEFEVSAIPVQTQNFSWHTSLNITLPNNRLLEFKDLDLSTYRYNYRMDEPLDIALLYKYDGIDPLTGMYSVVDTNEDGRLDFEDQNVVKRVGRQYYGGINNTFKIKNFNIGFLLEYVRQHSMFSPFTITPGRFGNNTREVLDPWRQEGDNTNVQRLSQRITSLLTYNNVLNSDFAITDASFLRLRTLSLTYQFPKRLLSDFGISDLDLFLHAQNLFTITGFPGLDPQGGQTVPPLRTITCGIKINI